MLKFTSLQFLYKTHGLMDVVFSSKTKVKLTLNDQYQYFNLQESTSNSKIIYKIDTIKPIELPTNRRQHQLTFQIYKDGHYIGKARSFLNYGKNKKDCLDLVDKNFKIIGKLMYDAKWQAKSYASKMITLDQYYKFGMITNNPNPYTTRTLQQGQKHKQPSDFPSYKPYNNGRPQIFQYNHKLNEPKQQWGCFGCFSGNKISTLDEINLKRLRNFPLIYKQSQLELVHSEDLVKEQIIKPMFYSKRFYKVQGYNQ